MKVAFILVTALVMCNVTPADAQLSSWLGRVGNALGVGGGGGKAGKGGMESSLSSISHNDVVAALKEALEVGTRNASSRLSALNGYFGNELIKIAMPAEAQRMAARARRAGLGEQVDRAILSMNRAAEDAAGKVVPIFLGAIRGMSITDGVAIVRGGAGAATAYLKNKTSEHLTNALRPIIHDSLDKVGATRHWGEIFTFYNKLPFVTKVTTDLTTYVNDRALHGLFFVIAEEENKIRENPRARITSLLKKVFGASMY